MYKSMRDALRYQNKRISGKSGDSGDEISIDETSKDDSEFKDALSFLGPTATRFPRKVIVLGGSTETPNANLTLADTSINDIPEEDTQLLRLDPDDEASGSTVYSYVCISIVKFGCSDSHLSLTNHFCFTDTKKSQKV